MNEKLLCAAAAMISAGIFLAGVGLAAHMIFNGLFVAALVTLLFLTGLALGLVATAFGIMRS